MDKFNLPAGEIAVYECTNVTLDGTYGTAILTDKHIYHITTGFFGGIKTIEKLPLREIRIENGKAQIKVQFAVLEGSSLIVYTHDGSCTYEFRDSLANEAKKWGDYIAQKLTGYTVDVEQTGEIAEVATQIRGAIDAFKGAFGMKSIIGSNESVSKKCIGCRAPISGNKGSTIRCPYCDTEQKL